MSASEDADELNLAVINLFLSFLYKKSYESLSLEELQEIGTDVHLSYSHDEIDFIERKTRSQSSSKLWYRFRAGRVTGSVFKSVCRTPILSPSKYLILKICFPEKYIFNTVATTYGKTNEFIARAAYITKMQDLHVNFRVKDSGLVLNNNYPFCGVSPDGLTSCDCCGDGVLEIKCPYLMRSGNSQPYLNKRDCPIKEVRDAGNRYYKLQDNHEYYYQVQMEMSLTNRDFCDFVVWNPKDVIIIRVDKNEQFWAVEYEKALTFFNKALLPELLGVYYSNMKKIKNGRFR